MNFKKILIIISVYFLTISNAQSIQPDVFVQSTVNRASEILSKNISKEEKNRKIKTYSKRNCRY